MYTIHRTITGTAVSTGFVPFGAPLLTPGDLDIGVMVEEWDATADEADHFQQTGQVPARQARRVVVGERE